MCWYQQCLHFRAHGFCDNYDSEASSGNSALLPDVWPRHHSLRSFRCDCCLCCHVFQNLLWPAPEDKEKQESPENQQLQLNSSCRGARHQSLDTINLEKRSGMQIPIIYSDQQVRITAKPSICICPPCKETKLKRHAKMHDPMTALTLNWARTSYSYIFRDNRHMKALKNFSVLVIFFIYF